MDRGAWRATIHRIAKSQTWLKWLSMDNGPRSVWAEEYHKPGLPQNISFCLPDRVFSGGAISSRQGFTVSLQWMVRAWSFFVVEAVLCTVGVFSSTLVLYQLNARGSIPPSCQLWWPKISSDLVKYTLGSRSLLVENYCSCLWISLLLNLGYIKSILDALHMWRKFKLIFKI